MPDHNTPKSRESAPHDVQAEAPKHGALGHLSADEELQQAVCEALIENTDLDSRNIGVKVVSDTIILSGSVKSRAAWSLALQIANAQPGVSSVQADELQVGHQ